MHELAIVSSLLEAVSAEAQRLPRARIVKVGLRIGELSGVEPEALSFCFEASVKGTEMEPVTLEIERTARRDRCRQCLREFSIVDDGFACPGCGASETSCVGGDELELAYLEVEES